MYFRFVYGNCKGYNKHLSHKGWEAKVAGSYEFSLYELMGKLFQITKTFSYALHVLGIQKIMSYKLGQMWILQLRDTW